MSWTGGCKIELIQLDIKGVDIFYAIEKYTKIDSIQYSDCNLVIKIKWDFALEIKT